MRLTWLLLGMALSAGAGADTMAGPEAANVDQLTKPLELARTELVPQNLPGLKLGSGAALVLDQETGHILYEKNTDARLPIASVTKLMTAMVVLDANLPLDEKIKITDEDVDRLKWSASRLAVGTTQTRLDLLKLALVASENRAAHALARTYPGGMNAFLRAANRKAQQLGMMDTHFDDPTGLHATNRSTALDLSKMVQAAYRYDMIRDISTTPVIEKAVRKRALTFKNTNALVRSKEWDIGLSKTGFIREAGYCLVMQAQIASRNLIIVLLDADGKQTRMGDAKRIKTWLEHALSFKSV